LGFDGPVKESGSVYRWLSQNDPNFDTWLLESLPQSKDLGFVHVALWHFHHNGEKFEEAVLKVPEALLDQTVIESSADVLYEISIRDLIKEYRQAGQQDSGLND